MRTLNSANYFQRCCWCWGRNLHSNDKSIFYDEHTINRLLVNNRMFFLNVPRRSIHPLSRHTPAVTGELANGELILVQR